MACGHLKAILAKATLDFCPPDKKHMGLNAKFPLRPNDPKWFLITSCEVPGNVIAIYSNGDTDRSNESTWCCVNNPSLILLCLKELPAVSSNSPVKIFNRVDFPHPFLPNNAILELVSTFIFISSRITLFPYAKDPSSTLSKGGESLSTLGRMNC